MMKFDGGLGIEGVEFKGMERKNDDNAAKKVKFS